MALALVLSFRTAPLQAEPPPGSQWEPIPDLTDEFNGDKLDSAKWYDHNPGWTGRKPGFFSTNNVSVGGGKLHLTARAEDLGHLPDGYHTFTTAAVKSKALIRYGYFEIKCRPMKSKVSSAFWFYSITEDEWSEIDVFEICGMGENWTNAYNTSVHVFRTPAEKKHWAKSETWKAPFALVDDDHVYALEWTPEEIKWRVEGQVVRTVENTHWHQPLNMNFDSETMPKWFGLPEIETLPSVFSIDYIRSWRVAGNQPDGGGALIPEQESREKARPRK